MFFYFLVFLLFFFVVKWIIDLKCGIVIFVFSEMWYVFDKIINVVSEVK